MIRQLIVIGLTLIGGFRAEAYSISTHVMLTKRAVEEHEICRKWTGFKALPTRAAETLSYANAYEDIAFWIKSLNWHFYHPSKNLGASAFGLGNRSLQMRFQELEKQVERDHSLDALGGLIHFVQDMTNPAHVAPVFHIIEDSFDNYDFNRFPAKTISESECREIAVQTAQRLTYFTALDSVSRETLKQMDETFSFTENGQTRALQWREAFWNPDTENSVNGFGRYGKFGNNFGSAQIKSAAIDPEVYSEFAKRQIRRALNATIVFFEIYQNAPGAH